MTIESRNDSTMFIHNHLIGTCHPIRHSLSITLLRDLRLGFGSGFLNLESKTEPSRGRPVILHSTLKPSTRLCLSDNNLYFLSRPTPIQEQIHAHLEFQENISPCHGSSKNIKWYFGNTCARCGRLFVYFYNNLVVYLTSTDFQLTKIVSANIGVYENCVRRQVPNSAPMKNGVTKTHRHKHGCH